MLPKRHGQIMLPHSQRKLEGTGNSAAPHSLRSAKFGAVRSLVKRAVKSGDIREDLDAIDLLRALVGVASVGPGPDWQQSAKKLVDILILGSRPFK